MKHLFRITFLALLMLPITAMAQVSESTVKQARVFVEDVTDTGIGILSANSGKADMANQFRTLLNKNFDMNYIGRFAMGRYWRSLDDQNKKEYLSLFEDMIVDVYSKRFKDYNGEKMVIQSARADGKYDVLVNSMIKPKSGPDIRVDWRVREKNGNYKIIDIMVEGVSMALTQRSDFSSVIQRGGGDVEVLLNHLRKY